MPEMTSPRGEPVEAVFGFARDLLYLLESGNLDGPTSCSAAFDLPGKTFRHELYEQYKAGRPEMHVDLVPQIAPIRRMVEALGLPVARAARPSRPTTCWPPSPASPRNWADIALSSPATRTAGN